MLPEYKPGDWVIISPSTEPRHHDDVVVRMRDTEGVMLKIYNRSGADNVILTSYNSDHFPPLHFKRSDFLFVYAVVELHRRKRS